MSARGVPARGPDDTEPLASVSDLGARRVGPIEDDGLERLLGDLDAALPRPPRALILALALLGLGQLAIVVPWLFETDPFGLLGQSSSGHLARDGALGLAVASGALLTAWTPRWAVPCFVLSSIAVTAQAIASLAEEAQAHVGGTEFIHVPSLILTCLTGLASIKLRALGPSRG
jgi:hypothetical protein